MKPDKAFILAAGLGTRLRPYTDSKPKPMVEVAGISLIHRAIKKLEKAGVREVVINTHHLAPVMEEHLKIIHSPKIIISREDVLLDTGGSIKKALHHFGSDPFYIINGDALWEDADTDSLLRLQKQWDNNKMDILLLLQPVQQMVLTKGVGDYRLMEDGKAIRTKDLSGDYMFAGIRIAHPRIFENTIQGKFSFLSLMDEAEKQGRLYALAHDSAWHHISTPEDLHAVDAHFRARENS